MDQADLGLMASKTEVISSRDSDSSGPPAIWPNAAACCTPIRIAYVLDRPGILHREHTGRVLNRASAMVRR